MMLGPSIGRKEISSLETNKWWRFPEVLRIGDVFFQGDSIKVYGGQSSCDILSFVSLRLSLSFHFIWQTVSLSLQRISLEMDLNRRIKVSLEVTFVTSCVFLLSLLLRHKNDCFLSDQTRSHGEIKEDRLTLKKDEGGEEEGETRDKLRLQGRRSHHNKVFLLWMPFKSLLLTRSAFFLLQLILASVSVDFDLMILSWGWNFFPF